MKFASLFPRRLVSRFALVLLVFAGLSAGCSDYTTYGEDVGYNVQYGETYYGSGVYSSSGYYGGGPYYGYGGGGVIVTPPRPSAPRPTPYVR